MNATWIRDTGLVFALISLFFASQGSKVGLVSAVALILVTLLCPSLLRPLAWLWFIIAGALGTVMPRVFFGLIFFIVVTPMGLVRRLCKSDVRDFSRDTTHTTSFIPMGGLVVAADMVHPY